MPLLEKWWFEHLNKSVEWEALIDSMRVKGAEFKDKFSFEVLTLCDSFV